MFCVGSFWFVLVSWAFVFRMVFNVSVGCVLVVSTLVFDMCCAVIILLCWCYFVKFYSFMVVLR